jgi:hypothetical protein
MVAECLLDEVSEVVLDRVAPGWQTVFPAESGVALADFCAEWMAQDSARERNEVVEEAEDAAAAREYHPPHATARAAVPIDIPYYSAVACRCRAGRCSNG